MIRVLVAEDEPPILKSVCRNIEKANTRFSVVGQVYDGQEARKFLEQEGDSIDVLVTDINMPVEDGLVLLEYVQKTFPDMVTVVLSGFQEFEYAKQAFKYGVIDYLSKPIDRELLRTLLGRIVEVVEGKRSERQHQVLFDAVQSPLPPDSGENCEAVFSLGLICSGPFPISEYDYLLPGREFWDRHDLAVLAADNFGRQDHWLLPGKSSVEELLLFPALVEGGCRFVKSLYQSIVHLDGPPVTFYWMPGPYKLDELAQAHHIARKELHRNLVVGQSSFLKREDLNGTQKDGSWSGRWYDGIQGDVTTLSNAGLVTAILSRIKEALGTVPRQVDFEEFLAFVFTTVVNTAADARKYRDIEAAINRLITNSSKTGELLDGAEALLIDILLPSGPRQMEKDRKIQDMADYLALNYNKPVSNTTLSLRFGMVPSYVSSIFKSHMGVTPSEYIRDMRMDRARELLGEDRDLLLKDIAAMVGYSDPLYFSRVFKKHFGINPSQVKNQRPPED